MGLFPMVANHCIDAMNAIYLFIALNGFETAQISQLEYADFLKALNRTLCLAIFVAQDPIDGLVANCNQNEVVNYQMLDSRSTLVLIIIIKWEKMF